MQDWIVAHLAEIIAIQAQIEGMKATNIERENKGYALAYGEKEFEDKANELFGIANNIWRNR